MSEKFVTVSGLKTRYVEEGSGPATIVLIHGGALTDPGYCPSATVWEHNIAGLSKNARVLAYDAPGHGGSEAPKEDQDYSYDGLVRHARGFLDATGVKKAHLVGHDEGAMIALRLAFEAPEQVASLTIVASPAIAPAGDADINFALMGRPYPLYSEVSQRWLLSRTSYTDHHLRAGRWMEEAAKAAQSDAFRALRAKLTEGKLGAQVKASLAKLKANNYVRFRETGVSVPTLMVWGNDDPLSPVPFAVSLFEIVSAKQPLTQIRILNQAGSMPFREQAPAFDAAVGSFVRALGT